MPFNLVSAVILALTPLSFAAAPNLNGTQWTKTLFKEEFNGPSGTLPSAQNWIIDTGTQYPGGAYQWGTGEVETYTNSTANLQLSGNSSLHIIPRKSSKGAWTSGRIETIQSNFMAPVGGKMRIEASIYMPAVNSTNGLGYWPAFFTLGQNFRGNYTNWPGVGEYDIMENVNALNSVNYGLHCGTNPYGPCNEPSGITQRTACPGSSCNGNYHTYTVTVDRTVSPEIIRFFIDSQLQRNITETQVNNATAWNNAVHHGHFIVLDLAIGGAYPNYVANTTTPTAATVGGKEMRVDYVAVWTTS